MLKQISKNGYQCHFRRPCEIFDTDTSFPDTRLLMDVNRWYSPLAAQTLATRSPVLIWFHAACFNQVRSGAARASQEQPSQDITHSDRWPYLRPLDMHAAGLSPFRARCDIPGADAVVCLSVLSSGQADCNLAQRRPVQGAASDAGCFTLRNQPQCQDNICHVVSCIRFPAFSFAVNGLMCCCLHR